MDASEIYPRRITAKEVLTTHRGEEFYFPSRRWYSKIGRKRQRIVRSTPRQEQPVRSEDLSRELQVEPEVVSTDRIKR